MLDLFYEHESLLNFLLAVIGTFSGALVWLVRKLSTRLREQIKFSPATALAIGYFQNFLFKIGPELARNPSLTIEGKPCDLPLNHRRMIVFVPENLPSATHQGVETFKSKIEAGGRRVAKAELTTGSRPFSFWALIDEGNPQAPPILFDYPTALGNMVEVLNYHMGEKTFGRKTNKRIKAEKQEIENFSTVINQLIHDKGFGDVFLVTHDEPGKNPSHSENS